MAANRTKTIEYIFETDVTSRASGGAHLYGSPVIYIPETTSRNFKSVYMIMYGRENSSTAASITAWNLNLSADYGSHYVSDVTATAVSSTITNSGEQWGHVFVSINMADHFNSYFGSGTSATLDVGISVTGVATINVGAKLVITYEFDDTAHTTTRIKTVRIPLEGRTDYLTTAGTYYQLGSSDIPALDTFLPEASKTYRQIWIEIWGDNGVSAATATNPSLTARIMGSTTKAFGANEDALNTAVGYHYFWNVTSSLTTSAAQTFELTCDVAARFGTPNAMVCVTYEYNASTTSTYLNSLVLPFYEETGFAGRTAAADQSYCEQQIWIQEPGTITMVQSGVAIWYTCGATVGTVYVKVGNQSAYKAYTHRQGSAYGGNFCISQRIDSSSTQGAALVLQKGLNTISVQLYSNNTTNTIGSATGLLFLNYTSGVDSTSTERHNKTIYQHIDKSAALTAAQEYEAAAVAPTILESNYRIIGVGLSAYLNAGGQDYALCIAAEEIASTTELLTNGGFATTDNWTGIDCNLTSDAGGQSGNCLTVTRTGGTTQKAYQLVSGLTIGNIYQLTGYVKQGTSGAEAFRIGVASITSPITTIYETRTGTSSGSFVQYTLIFPAKSTSMAIFLEKSTSTAGTMLFDTFSLLRLKDGWIPLFAGGIEKVIERDVNEFHIRARSNYMRYPNDPDSSRMDIETSRKYRVQIGGPSATANLGNSNSGLVMYYTYHSITSTISGTVSGYSGDGSGITVDIFRADNDELVYTTTTTTGGSYSVTVYDNTMDYYACARQDDTHVGRSTDETPT